MSTCFGEWKALAIFPSLSAATILCARRCTQHFSITPSMPGWTWALSMLDNSQFMTICRNRFLNAVEDVLFNRRSDATDRLVNLAGTLQGKGKKKRVSRKWRKLPVEKRLSHALVEGILEYIEADTEEARLNHERPIQVIEGTIDGRYEPRR